MNKAPRIKMHTYPASFQLPAVMQERINKISEATSLTKSEIIRAALSEYLDKLERKEKKRAAALQ